ncbi:MAG: hypothetical protein PVH38_05560, partial [Gammaproteobacteria bacterium]
MSVPGPDREIAAAGNTERGSIERCKSMTIIEQRNIWQRGHARIYRNWELLRDRVQRTPLAYKLSFFITVLVVSCMSLLGIILIQ